MLFLVAISTDGVDGYLARRRNLVTDVGVILDPIADKILTGGALVSLSILGELPWWVTVLILVREFGITALRLATLRARVIPASWGGKWKTVLQAVAITLFLLAPWRLLGEWAGGSPGSSWAPPIALTLVTGVDYLIRAWRLNRAERERRPLRPRRSDLLVERSLTIAVAESLTGGLLVAELIRTPGASATVRGGIVAYATELKHTLLGVDAGLLAEHGAMHPEVARQMAVGVRERSPSRGARRTSGLRPPGSPDPTRRTASRPATVFLGFAVGDRVDGGARSRSRATGRRSGAAAVSESLAARSKRYCGNSGRFDHVTNRVLTMNAQQSIR